MDLRTLAARLEATLLDPLASQADIEALVAGAEELGCAGVCTYPRWLPVTATSPLASVCVISFPHGADLTVTKAAAAYAAVSAGADEIDMVCDLAAARAGDWGRVFDDIALVVAEAGPAAVKVILETGALTPVQIAEAGRAVSAAGAAYAKTCTGMGPRGATVEDIRLLRTACAPETKLKASGGIRALEQAQAMVAAGADRIGCSAPAAILAA